MENNSVNNCTIKNLKSLIGKKQRQLDKARSFFYPSVYKLEQELDELKTKLSAYKLKLRNK